MDFEFDHVGIAVDSIDKGSQFYKALGYSGPDHIEIVDSEKVKVAMYKLGNKSQIELLEPTSEDSPIAKFLSKRGPGIHHLCIRVKDIKAVMSQLKKAGVRLLSEEPKPGAHGCQVAFVHPKSAGGVLWELSQVGAKEE